MAQKNLVDIPRTAKEGSGPARATERHATKPIFTAKSPSHSQTPGQIGIDSYDAMSYHLIDIEHRRLGGQKSESKKSNSEKEKNWRAVHRYE
jgi:hypothetical protein